MQFERSFHATTDATIATTDPIYPAAPLLTAPTNVAVMTMVSFHVLTVGLRTKFQRVSLLLAQIPRVPKRLLCRQLSVHEGQSAWGLGSSQFGEKLAPYRNNSQLSLGKPWLLMHVLFFAFLHQPFPQTVHVLLLLLVFQLLNHFFTMLLESSTHTLVGSCPHRPTPSLRACLSGKRCLPT